jgi:hypothetical protein
MIYLVLKVRKSCQRAKDIFDLYSVNLLQVLKRKKFAVHNCSVYSSLLAPRYDGKDVKILPLSTSFYVEPTARQNFNVVSGIVVIIVRTSLFGVHHGSR